MFFTFVLENNHSPPALKLRDLTLCTLRIEKYLADCSSWHIKLSKDAAAAVFNSAELLHATATCRIDCSTPWNHQKCIEWIEQLAESRYQENQSHHQHNLRVLMQIDLTLTTLKYIFIICLKALKLNQHVVFSGCGKQFWTPFVDEDLFKE